MVGHPGYAPGVSPSQAARIGYLPRARGFKIDLIERGLLLKIRYAMAANPVSTSDPIFLDTLKAWLQAEGEILLLSRFAYAAGNREFEFFCDFPSLEERLNQLPKSTSVIAFRQRQLPIRGIVDDSFIERCLKEIPESADYALTETVKRVYGKRSWFHHGGGRSHADLREDLEESRGTPVAVGVETPWFNDTENVISAYVPDQNGCVKVGSY
jgi:hypothetical protein